MSNIINSSATLLQDALQGLGRAHAHKVRVDTSARLVLRKVEKESGKVALISGGGSGHEPMHAGFVGAGMLDAACLGEVFTSPTPDQMMAATQQVDRGAGVLFIVKNYAGDIMNFEMAAEMCGVKTQTVLVSDDVALFDLNTGNAQGDRGVAGTVVVEKIVGALAERGADIAACAAAAAQINDATGSMAVALTSCTVPAVGTPTFAIQAGEMEVGVGIHGEAGRQRTALQTADGIAEILVNAILTKIAPKKSDPLLLFCNGLGATPLIEQYILFNSAANILDQKGYNVARSLVGSYCSSLDMAGASLTISRLSDDVLPYWDDPVDTISLNW